MIKIIGEKLEKIPWEDKPTGCPYPIWRFSENPVIPRNLLKNSNSIFNSAVVGFENKFAGVFRCDNRAREMRIHAGFSDDGINWKINEEPIKFIGNYEFEYAYDPRVCKIENEYIVTWCNGYHGPTIGMAKTKDFQKFYQMENAFLPYNRNGVLFPRKINNKYYMLSRPSDTGHTAFGDIFCSESPDLIYWGKHRHVMSKIGIGWQSTKIGAGPIPIETTEGWLIFYHGVLNSCNGFVYSFGGALLDINQPWKVIARAKDYFLSPQKLYECVGDVPNVVFPCAALSDSESGKIAIYYGAADTVTGLAFCQVDEIVEFIKSNNFIRK